MARRATTSRKPTAADLKLRERIQSLTPELFNMIRDYYFLCVGLPRTVHINLAANRNQGPPAHLAIDCRSRRQAIASYYGNGRIFVMQMPNPTNGLSPRIIPPNGRTVPQVGSTLRLQDWLRALTPAALRRISCIHLVAKPAYEKHFTATINQQGLLVSDAQAELVAERKYNWLDQLEFRVGHAAPALRRGVLRLRFEATDENGVKHGRWLNRDLLGQAWDVPNSSTWAEFFEAQAGDTFA